MRPWRHDDDLKARHSYHPPSRRHRPGDRETCGPRRRQHRGRGENSRGEPKLPRTIHSAAAEIEGSVWARPWRCNRHPHEASRVWRFEPGGGSFGGIDILVNNAKRDQPHSTPAAPISASTIFLLMFGVTARTYRGTQSCRRLIKSAEAGRNPHVLNMSPPLIMREHWFQAHGVTRLRSTA